MVFTLENFFDAWNEFKKGKQWKADVLLFERNLEDNLFVLYHDLNQGAYRHQPYTRFSIYDPKYRLIHKATVRDRVVHHLVFKFLEPIVQPTFIHHSYSCQKGKGIDAAMSDVNTALRKESRNYTQVVWSLKLDIQKFFDSVDHEILLKELRRYVGDSFIISLLSNIIRSYSSGQGQGKGVPIGNLTSQIFANIYMTPFDYFVKHELKVKRYFRYTDDLLFAHPSRDYLLALQEKIEQFFNKRLALNIHPKKIYLRKLSQGIDFVGYVFLPHHRVLRTKTKRRMFTKMHQKAACSSQELVDDTSLHQSLQSYAGLLQHCQGHSLRQRLYNDAWLQKSNPLNVEDGIE